MKKTTDNRGAARPATELRGGGRPAPKVLMIDDDQAQLMIVRTWLEACGCQVMTQDSPFGTGRTILREQPDILLLDIEMPGLGGQSLAEMLSKQAGPTAPGIIFYSGKEQATLDTMVRAHGALGAISKTHDSNTFLAQFKRLSGAWMASRK